MKRPFRILDLFCGVGGVAMGYHYAGFEVVGIDLEPQPRFPFRFYQRDALTLDPEWIRSRFDAVHASPPCQAYTQLRHVNDNKHPKLIKPVRKLLKKTGLPYVIENVEGAPMKRPVMLCGSSFGLRVQRHRLFEVNFPLVAPPCDHDWQKSDPVFKVYAGRRAAGHYVTGIVPVYGHSQVMGDGGSQLARRAMEIDWAGPRREVTEAIPPCYTEYIGGRLYRYLSDPALTAPWR